MRRFFNLLFIVSIMMIMACQPIGDTSPTNSSENDEGYELSSNGKIATVSTSDALKKALSTGTVEEVKLKSGNYDDSYSVGAGKKISGSAETKIRSLTVTGNGSTIDSPVITSLITAKSLGDGELTLNNVTVEGESVFQGGGSESIKITGASKFIGSVTLEKDGLSLKMDASVIIEKSIEILQPASLLSNDLANPPTIKAKVVVNYLSTKPSSINVKVENLFVSETVTALNIGVQAEVTALISLSTKLQVSNLGSIAECNVKAAQVSGTPIVKEITNIDSYLTNDLKSIIALSNLNSTLFKYVTADATTDVSLDFIASDFTVSNEIVIHGEKFPLTWESSNTNVISISGTKATVTRSDSETKSVELKVTVKIGETTLSKSFTAVVASTSGYLFNVTVNGTVYNLSTFMNPNNLWQTTSTYQQDYYTKLQGDYKGPFVDGQTYSYNGVESTNVSCYGKSEDGKKFGYFNYGYYNGQANLMIQVFTTGADGLPIDYTITQVKYAYNTATISNNEFSFILETPIKAYTLNYSVARSIIGDETDFSKISSLLLESVNNKTRSTPDYVEGEITQINMFGKMLLKTSSENSIRGSFEGFYKGTYDIAKNHEIRISFKKDNNGSPAEMNTSVKTLYVNNNQVDGVWDVTTDIYSGKTQTILTYKNPTLYETGTLLIDIPDTHTATDGSLLRTPLFIRCDVIDTLLPTFETNVYYYPYNDCISVSSIYYNNTIKNGTFTMDIKRSESETGSFVSIIPTGPETLQYYKYNDQNSTYFEDKNITTGKTYYYKGIISDGSNTYESKIISVSTVITDVTTPTDWTKGTIYNNSNGNQVTHWYKIPIDTTKKVLLYFDKEGGSGNYTLEYGNISFYYYSINGYWVQKYNNTSQSYHETPIEIIPTSKYDYIYFQVRASVGNPWNKDATYAFKVAPGKDLNDFDIDQVYISGFTGSSWASDTNSGTAIPMTNSNGIYTFKFKAGSGVLNDGTPYSANTVSTAFPYGFKFTTNMGWQEQIIAGNFKTAQKKLRLSAGESVSAVKTSKFELTQIDADGMALYLDDFSKFWFANEIIEGNEYTITLDKNNMTVKIDGEFSTTVFRDNVALLSAGFYVAGDFTNWTPTKLTNISAGVYSGVFNLTSENVFYGFVINNPDAQYRFTGATIDVGTEATASIGNYENNKINLISDGQYVIKVEAVEGATTVKVTVTAQ